MKVFGNSRGIGLIMVAVSGAIIAAAAMMLMYSVVGSKKRAARNYEELVARAYATELIEFFRSMPDDQVKAYLETNPINGGFDPYNLCAHINIVDRNGGAGQIVNQDPLADVGTKARLKDLNRFYQVQLVNVEDLSQMNRWPSTEVDPLPVVKGCTATNDCLCAYNATGIFFPGRTEVSPQVQLDPNQKLLITVGVSWMSGGSASTFPRRVALSTILPSVHP